MAVEKDIVLIYYEDAPLVFARIEEILPDHKPGWYHVRLLMLQVPVQTATWILRDAYIDGDPFTMDGKKMRLEKVDVPDETADDTPETLEEKAPSTDASGGEVISFADLKKER
jgi:hypothetical protein